MKKEKKVIKNKEDKTQEFIKEYTKLCEKYKKRIVVVPRWRVSQDTGDWRLVLESSVQDL